jgi:hypothetical protein
MKKIIFFIFCLPFVVNAQPSGSWLFKGALPVNGNFIPVDSTFLLNYNASSLYISDDGGNSWRLQQISADFFPFKPSIILAPSRTIFFAYQDSIISSSQNTGVSWNKKFFLSDTLRRFSGIKMWSENDGFILLSDTNGHYHSLFTHDGWNSVIEVNNDSILQVVAHNDSQSPSITKKFSMSWIDSLNGCLWISRVNKKDSSNPILVTHNGGKEWSIVQLPQPPSGTNVLLAKPEDYGTGAYFNTYCLMPSYPWPSAYFFYSIDFGDHWLYSDTAKLPTNIASIAQSDKKTLWASALQSKNDPNTAPRNALLYSSDLGNNWIIDRTTFKDFDLGILYFTDSLHGFAIASDPIHPFDSLYMFSFIGARSAVKYTPFDNGSLVVFPNPCSDFINFTSSKEYSQIFICDLLGRKLIQSSGAKRFDTSSLPNGIYAIWYISNNGKPASKSFIKSTP